MDSPGLDQRLGNPLKKLVDRTCLLPVAGMVSAFVRAIPPLVHPLVCLLLQCPLKELPVRGS